MSHAAWLGSLGLNGIFLDMLSRPSTLKKPTSVGHVIAVLLYLGPGFVGVALLGSTWCGLAPWFLCLGILGPSQTTVHFCQRRLGVLF